METGRVLCFAAKWDGSKDVFYSSEHLDGHRVMIEHLHNILSEADAIVTYNGERFDIPTANREFLLYDMPPPTPYKSIDLIQTIKRRFRFVRNSLDHVCKEMGIGRKVKHEGHELWLKCMNGDGDAWGRMRVYNMQDVELTEDAYHRLLPWIEQHPSHALYIEDDKPRCRNCGTDQIRKEGFAYTQLGKYQQYSCKLCGTWGRGKKSLKMVDVR